MQIWIFNPYDDVPGEGKPQRYWTLCDELSKLGHDVVWWSSSWSHRRKATRHDIAIGTKSGNESSDNLSVAFSLRLVTSPSYYRNIGLRRLWNHRVWGQNLYKDGCNAVDTGELERPDLVIASLPPMEGAVAALRLRSRYGCKVVTDIMDAWPDTLLQASPSYARGLARVILTPYYKMLRLACGESDALSAQSKLFAEYAKRVRDQEFGDTEEQPYVCYLGAEAADSCESLRGTEAHAILRIVYLGAMGRSYDLETVVESIRLINEAQNSEISRASRGVEVVFVGDGEKRASLEAAGLSNLRFTGFLNGETLDEELRMADVGIVPFLPESGVAVPYKAGEYLGYDLPILSNIAGELEDVIEQYDCGLVYRPRDVKGLASAIQKYLDDPDLLTRQRVSARECYSEIFDRTKIYPLFASWLCSIIK